MIKFFSVLAFAALSFAPAALADSIRGTYQGHGFTAYVDDARDSADLVWDDGTPGVTLPRDHSQVFRCDCAAFKSFPRQLIVEWQIGTGEIQSARYERLDGQGGDEWTESVHGTYGELGFVVSVNADKSLAKLEWDDGTPGFTLPYDPTQTFRCACHAYKTYPRQILVEWEMTGEGRIQSAKYQRLDR